VLTEIARRGSSDPDSVYSAGKADFWLSEQDFNVWSAVLIQGTIEEQQQIVQEQISGIPALVGSYSTVTDIGSAEWTMAAYFMIGRVYQAFADKLYQVPIPESIALDEDLSFAYQMELEDAASRFEDEAVANWQVAMEVARQTGIVNEWTNATIRELNRYLGGEFPLYKEEPEFIQTDWFSPPDLIVPDAVLGGDDMSELDNNSDFEPIGEPERDLSIDDGFESEEFDDFSDDDFEQVEPFELIE
jgi:hypothetical protein